MSLKLALGLLSALLSSSCALRFRYPDLAEPPAVVERMVCCGSIEEKNGWAESVGEKSAFAKGTDAAVYSFIAFKELRGAHALSWKWYDPSRRLYRAMDPIEIGEAEKLFDRYIAWDKIAVSDDKENGRWTVAVFLDGRWLISREFEIQ